MRIAVVDFEHWTTASAMDHDESEGAALRRGLLPSLGARGRAATAPAPRGEIRVWSLFIRLFHWGLVAAFLTSYFLDDDPDWHENAGYVVLGLVILRLPWGIWGPARERFGDFVCRPSIFLRYLIALVRGKSERHLGHNPAGGYMIVALLIILIILTVSGAIMTTDAYWGNKIVERIHYTASDIAIILIAIHVCGGLVTSLLHRENLILAMITGRRRSGEVRRGKAQSEHGE